MTLGLEVRQRKVVADSRMQTSVPGAFAVGDASTYDGRVVLIVAGFGEAATAINNAVMHLAPEFTYMPGHSAGDDLAPPRTRTRIEPRRKGMRRPGVTYVIVKECIDCGTCELVCHEVALFGARRARGNAKWKQFTTDNAEFFTVTLPGRDTPLGDPGGHRWARTDRGRHHVGYQLGRLR